MKKILILANYSAGLYDFRHDLIIELKKCNSVYAATPDGDKIDLLRDICDDVILTDVDRRGTNPFKDIKLISAYYKIIKNIKPDLVITYTVKPNLYGGFASRLLKIPYAVNITGLGSAIEGGGLLQKAICAMYKPVLKNARTVFFENSDNRDRMVKFGCVDEDKTKVLNGAGVNIEEYPFMPYPHYDEVRFLFVGRLMKEKGVDELLAAAKRLKEKYNDKVFIELVGNYEESYKETVDMLVSEGIVIYYGPQLDVKPFYEKCSAVVLPSYHEGMSNVLLEGGACGRPLIASDIPGCRETVIDGVSGMLFKPQNADDLYKKMDAFLNLSKVQREFMGTSSRKHIEKNFDKRKVVAETISSLF